MSKRRPRPKPQPKLTPRTQAELDKAIRDIFRLAEGKQEDWPNRRFQVALTRDGDHHVIECLSRMAAKAVYALAEETVEPPSAATRQIHNLFDRPYLPFSQTAWTRARVLVLHRLDGQPLRVGEGQIAAVDLAGGLALLYVLAVIRLAGLAAQP